MAQTTYQVILSTDGKHTVIATSDDAAMNKAALEWAKSTYDQVVARYGLKHEQFHKKGEETSEEEIPTCAVHNVPMTKQQGKFGSFWSCHKRNADGSFCSYRPNDQQS